jgi:hypothetical protein
MSEKTDRAIEIAELTQVMSSESGRNVMFRVLHSAGVDNDMFCLDTHEHALNAGGRRVGLYWREELKAAGLDNYFRMMKENDDN